MSRTPEINPLGWAVLAGIAAAGVYAFTSEKKPPTWWIPVRESGRGTDLKAEYVGEASGAHGLPTYFDKTKGYWVWADKTALRAEPYPKIESV